MSNSNERELAKIDRKVGHFNSQVMEFIAAMYQRSTLMEMLDEYEILLHSIPLEDKSKFDKKRDELNARKDAMLTSSPCIECRGFPLIAKRVFLFQRRLHGVLSHAHVLQHLHRPTRLVQPPECYTPRYSPCL